MAVAGVQQVLLEWLHAEGVAHLEVGVAAVGSGRVHPESVALAVEAGGFPGMAEACIGEVAEDTAGVGRLHRQLVVRAAPLFALPRVAGLADAFLDQAVRLAGSDRREQWQRRDPEQSRTVAGAARRTGRAGFSPRRNGLHAYRIRSRRPAADPTQLPGSVHPRRRGAVGRLPRQPLWRALDVDCSSSANAQFAAAPIVARERHGLVCACRFRQAERRQPPYKSKKKVAP